MGQRGVTLYLEHLKGQGQFAYFQLGLAASAIAFAVHQTRDASLEDTPWPIGAAVVLWALSFAFGCFGIEARQKAIRTNIQYLLALDEVPPPYRDHPELSESIEKAKQLVDKDAQRPFVRFDLQMWLLFGGALFYIWGHLLLMNAAG